MTQGTQRGKAANESRMDKPRNTPNTRKTDFVPARLSRIPRIPRFISFPKIRRSLRTISTIAVQGTEGTQEIRLRRLERDFLNEGGLPERMTRARLAHRAKQ
jgi:hypothetical protein